MGLFDFLKREPGYGDVVLGLAYADVPLKRWPAFLGSDHLASADAPLRRLLDAASAAERGDRDGARSALQAVADVPDAETRTRLLAWRGLRDLGEKPPAHLARVPRGLVCEVHLPHGLDVLACYEDRTARVYGAAGNAVVWEARDAEVDARIGAVLAQASALVEAVPAHKDLGLLLPRGMAALTALTFGGRHLRPERLDTLEGGRSKLSPLFAEVTQLFIALTQRGASRA